jgi:hypothetical protein
MNLAVIVQLFSKAQIYTLTLLAVEPPAVDSLQVESKDQAESPA